MRWCGLQVGKARGRTDSRISTSYLLLYLELPDGKGFDAAGRGGGTVHAAGGTSPPRERTFVLLPIRIPMLSSSRYAATG